MNMRVDVIKPALIVVGLWSQVAEDIEFGTGLQESDFKFTRQIGGGPARGYWQMEPATHDDIWNNYLRFRPTLAAKVSTLLPDHIDHVAQLETNHKYACVMSRLKYLRAPAQLPALGDIRGYGNFWKRYYNTAGGAGTVEEFMVNYLRTEWDPSTGSFEKFLEPWQLTVDGKERATVGAGAAG